MSNINKIKVSGQTYSIQDENACKVVELTQAEYDALPTSAKTSNSLFVITDATAGDLSNYYTKSETSGATEISTALGNKQDTLVSGTNIKTINNESILGTGNIEIQGGGKAISAGRGISVTTGETADTVSFNLPIYSGTGANSVIEGKIDGPSPNYATGYNTHAEGQNTRAEGQSSHAEGASTTSIGSFSHAEGYYSSAIGHSSHVEGGRNIANGQYSHAEGYGNNANGLHSHTEGLYNNANNNSEHASGQYNISISASTTFGNSGNTLFSVGNGTVDKPRHNAFEIRQNGDIYIADTNDTSTTNYYQKPMIKLQDALGGTVDTEITSASTNPVTSAAIYNQFGGLKLVKLTQSEYDALTTKDDNTVYFIGDSTNGYTMKIGSANVN